MLNNNLYLTFFLDDICCAIGIKHIKEVVVYKPITTIPCSVNFVKGIFDLRNMAIPVIDLHVKFNLPTTILRKETTIIVIDAYLDHSKDSVLLGILADKVEEVVELKSNELEAAPQFGSRISPIFLDGMGKKNDTIDKNKSYISVLNISNLFTKHEIDVINTVREEMN